MKDLRALNPYRVKNPFVEAMLSLSNIDGGNEHVSASFDDKTPSEQDMEWLGKQFFKPEELETVYEGPTGMPEAHTRHLWRRP